jgi:hypothetical protein
VKVARICASEAALTPAAPYIAVLGHDVGVAIISKEFSHLKMPVFSKELVELLRQLEKPSVWCGTNGKATSPGLLAA